MPSLSTTQLFIGTSLRESHINSTTICNPYNITYVCVFGMSVTRVAPCMALKYI